MNKGVNTIMFKDMCAAIDAGHEFSIGWRTHSTQTGLGGEWKEIKRGCKSSVQEKPKYLQLKQQEVIPENRSRKNPHHYENVTRNITNMDDDADVLHNIVKIHLRLVRSFNNQIVL